MSRTHCILVSLLALAGFVGTPLVAEDDHPVRTVGHWTLRTESAEVYGRLGRVGFEWKAVATRDDGAEVILTVCPADRSDSTDAGPSTIHVEGVGDVAIDYDVRRFPGGIWPFPPPIVRRRFAYHGRMEFELIGPVFDRETEQHESPGEWPEALRRRLREEAASDPAIDLLRAVVSEDVELHSWIGSWMPPTVEASIDGGDFEELPVGYYGEEHQRGLVFHARPGQSVRLRVAVSGRVCHLEAGGFRIDEIAPTKGARVRVRTEEEVRPGKTVPVFAVGETNSEGVAEIDLGAIGDEHLMEITIEDGLDPLNHLEVVLVRR